MVQHPAWLELINSIKFDQLADQFPRTAGLLEEIANLHTPEPVRDKRMSPVYYQCGGCGMDSCEEPFKWPSECRTTMLLLHHFGIEPDAKPIRHLSVVPEQRNGS